MDFKKRGKGGASLGVSFPSDTANSMIWAVALTASPGELMAGRSSLLDHAVSRNNAADEELEQYDVALHRNLDCFCNEFVQAWADTTAAAIWVVRFLAPRFRDRCH